MHTRFFLWGAALAAALLLATSDRAAAQANPQADFDQAAATFDKGEYENAAAAFEKFVTDYPTNALVFAARLRLAFASFLSRQLDKATVQLKQLLEPNTPAAPDVKELAQGLLPQVTAALATSAKPDSPEREKLFAQAINEFGEFLKKYPKSVEADQAFYGRALASYQIAKFDDAINDLRSSLESIPRSETILDTQYLLALTLSTKAANEAFNNPGSAAAASLFDESEKILRELASKKGELAVANDAIFQLGETVLNRASLMVSDPEQQNKLFNEAMGAFRRVQPKDVLLAVQHDRITQIREGIVNAQKAANLKEMNRLRKLLDREARKTGGIEARPDQKLGAILKIADVYYRLNEWNGLRTLANFLRPLVTTEDAQKALGYYTALSYAAQAIKDKAIEAYDAFQSKYRGDAMAENLPVFMGRMFLDPRISLPDEAVKYFQEAQDIYPKSTLKTAVAVQQASALVLLKRFDEAIEAYKKVLESKPSKEIAASAELGIARVHESTGKLDDAIAAFKKVRDEYDGAPEAEEAFYRTGSSLLAKGDAAGAEKEFKAFIEKHAQSVYTPGAYFFMAQAQSTLGRPEDAAASYALVAEKFPDTQFAPFTYFQRATLLAAKEDRAGAIEMLRGFIAKYPEHPNLYQAYTYVGETLFQLGKVDEAVKAFEDYASARSKEPTAPIAILKAAEYQRGKADTLGIFTALNEQEKAAWKTAVDAAQTACERVLSEYTDSPQVALSLQRLLGIQELRTESGIQGAPEVEVYFKNLATRFDANPGAKSKILFAFASFIAKSDPKKALDLMTQAYDATQVYAPADMDLYGGLLIDNKDYEKANLVYTKLGEDYPAPADGSQPTPDVRDAQAASLFGLGTLAQAANESGRAKELFESLKQKYPGSSKALQADLGIARSLSASGDYEAALALVAPIIGVAQAPSEVRAEALYIGGQNHKLLGNTEIAIDFFEKVQTYFPEQKDFAPDALWEAGQLLEQGAAGEADPKKKAALFQRARSAYDSIIKEYPDSAFKAKAEERLPSLPAAK